MNKSLKDNQTEIPPQELVLLGVFAVCIIPILANLSGIDFASNSIPISAEKMISGVVKPDDLFYAVSGGLHH